MDEWKSLAMAPEQKAGEKEKEKTIKYIYLSVSMAVVRRKRSSKYHTHNFYALTSYLQLLLQLLLI